MVQQQPCERHGSKGSDANLLGNVGYYGMSISSIVEFERELYFIGSGDRETAVITRLKGDPVNPVRDYQIIDRIGGSTLPLLDTATVASRGGWRCLGGRCPEA